MMFYAETLGVKKVFLLDEKHSDPITPVLLCKTNTLQTEG